MQSIRFHRSSTCALTTRLAVSVLGCLFFTSALFAAPTITVVSPKLGGTAGSPVYYEAYASSTCANGISAMRIYSAPSVPVFTTSGSHIEAFINLNPGSYATVINAWDNCGGVSTSTININVTATSGVTVFLPSASSASVPIHVAASAQSSSCSKGISAMRIYTASGVAPYTIDSNQLDAFVSLAPGAYDLVVQAWDNCGNVFKSSLAETAKAVPDEYLYAADNNYIYEFPLSTGKVSALGQVTKPSGNPAPELANLFVDAGGDFVYAEANSTAGFIYAYQIDRQNGSLFPVPGSPFNVSDTGAMVLDPNGQFLYLLNDTGSGTPLTLSSYRINRSNGELVLSSSTTLPAQSDFTLGINYTGAYLYAATIPESSSTEEIYAYAVSTNDGSFAPVAGSPYSIPGTAEPYFSGPTSAWKYLYQAQVYDAVEENLWGYEIGSDGALTMVPGSPFPAGNNPSSPMLADWLTHYVWSTGTPSSGDVIYTSGINESTGALGAATSVSTGSFLYTNLTEDHSGEFLYSGGSELTTQCTAYNGPFCPDAVGSWKIGSSLAQETQTGLTYTSGPGILAVATSR